MGNSLMPPDWRPQGSLRADYVLDAFVILGLLKDRVRIQEQLQLPDDGLQQNRLIAAMQERNTRYQLFGLPHSMHYCDGCTRFYDRRDEGLGIGTYDTGYAQPRSLTAPADKVSCVVVDGITIGHPCCAAPYCHIPLSNQQHKWCPEHYKLYGKCVVGGCNRPARRGKECCNDPEHRKMEKKREEPGRAINYLRYLNATRSVNHTTSTGFESADALEQAAREGTQTFDIGPGGQVRIVTPAELAREAKNLPPPPEPRPADEASSTQLKLKTGHKRVKAQFSRRRTHNEQFMHNTCGMMGAHATFYYSEALSSNVVRPATGTVLRVSHCPLQEFEERAQDASFWRQLVVYDYNCGQGRYLKDRPGKERWKDVGLPIDVFHFTSKHSKTDDFCLESCNPYRYPEMRTEDDQKWFFNTSVAEQNNMWIGGFNAVLRGMTQEKYGFVLSEVVTVKNEKTLRRLKETGQNPGFWSTGSV